MTDGPGASEDVVDGCVFCRIVRGTLPSQTVLDTEHCVAFRDLHPQAPVHVLVVPRRHVDDAAALGADDGEIVLDMLLTARRVAEAEGIAASGYRLIFNVGEDAANSVPHLHLHVIGGRRLSGQGG